MELYEDRIVNGLLKAGLSANSPAAVQLILDVDVEIVAPNERAVAADLWPCIWALAATLSRQFTGNVVIRGVLDGALPSPAFLGPRCIFSRQSLRTKRRLVTISLGQPSETGGLSGDARGAEIGLGCSCAGSEPAHPIAAFALAGYLGFAALAARTGIPPFREDLSVNTLRLATALQAPLPADGLAVLGLGQLGQAYLALLYFLQQHCAGPVRLLLFDKDTLGLENKPTEILFDDDADAGMSKAGMLAVKLRRFGWSVEPRQAEFTWETKRLPGEPRVALLGFDNMDARRMALVAGYDWVVEAGLRDSFTEPLVTWHSLPGGRPFLHLFPRSSMARDEPVLSGPFFKQLQETPGRCGWLTFAGVTASAPSMGLVAAAYAWAELLSHLGGNHRPYRGCARLWSPFLPYERSELPMVSQP